MPSRAAQHTLSPAHHFLPDSLLEREEALDRDEHVAGPAVPARGILIALALCAPFWVGLYVLVF